MKEGLKLIEDRINAIVCQGLSEVCFLLAKDADIFKFGGLEKREKLKSFADIFRKLAKVFDPQIMPLADESYLTEWWKKYGKQYTKVKGGKG